MFKTSPLIAALAATAIIAPAASATSNAAAPPVVWPEAPCNLNHRMDIAIIQGLFFECTCIRLQDGYQCDWMIIAGVSSAKLSRKPKHRRVTVKARVTVRPVTA